MILTLYQFSKKSNSTAIPGSGTTSHSCGEIYPKDKTSLESPVFQIDFNPTGYTYAKWGNYYYFITDVVYSTPIYEIHCEMDHLATYRSDILNSTLYVDRGVYVDSNFKDKMLYDSAISMSQEIGDSESILSSAIFTDSASGCYVIGVSNMTGGVDYYVLSPGALTTLISYATSDNSTIIQLVAQGLLNPIQYITSCVWYPMSASAFENTGGALEYIHIGPWVTTVQAYHPYDLINLSSPTTFSAGSIQATYSDFRDYSAGWTSATMRVFGQTISIDPKYLQDDIELRFTVDPITGQIVIRIYSNNGLITTVSSQFGVPVPITAASTNVTSTLGNIVSTVANIAAENYAGAIGNAFGALSSATGVTNTINGSVGNRAIAYQSKYAELAVVRQASCTVPDQEVGYPINRRSALLTLGNLTFNYIKCLHPSVAFNCLSASRTAINTELMNGIFIE